MEYEDKIRIATPEGIELEYTLAGLGSRFGAALIDLIIRLILLGALYGLLAVVAPNTVGAIIFLIAVFFAIFGYDIAFEVWGGGRTPGKRWSGLRVVMVTGQPVGFAASAVRNLMRIIDIYATVFIAGTVSILTTKRNQRLGDLAGHTIVLRERHAEVKGAVASDGVGVGRPGARRHGRHRLRARGNPRVPRPARPAGARGPRPRRARARQRSEVQGWRLAAG